MSISLATEADIPDVVRYGKAFADVAYPDIEYCELSMSMTAAQMVEDGTLLIARKDGEVAGGIGGFMSPMFMNRKVNVLVERFWWVFPKFRGKLGIMLLFEFEKLLKNRGGGILYMMSLEHVGVDDVHSLYEKCGFRLAERGYAKRV